MTGEELKAIREAWGMTQAEFGRALGYTIKSIANFESGRKPIREPLEKHILAEHRLFLLKKVIENA